MLLADSDLHLYPKALPSLTSTPALPPISLTVTTHTFHNGSLISLLLKPYNPATHNITTTTSLATTGKFRAHGTDSPMPSITRGISKARKARTPQGSCAGGEWG